MKRILLFAASVFVISACSGTIDDEQNGNQDIPEEYVGPYTLSADKTEVEASGVDQVTFSLKDKYDRDILLDRKALQKVNIVSEEGQRVARMETKTVFIANGTYNFSAKFHGEASENTVKITAKNRGQYEKFHKNVALYKATGAWCPACPGMTRAIEDVNEDTKNHMVELAWHNNDRMALTFSGSNNDCGALVAAYLTSGGSIAFPTVVLDLKEMTMEKSSSVLESAIWNLRANYPATCGIKVSSSYASGNITIDAELTSSEGGEYDLGAVVLLNDQDKTVMGDPNVDQITDNKYSHIVRAATGNFLMYFRDALKNVKKNESISWSQTFNVGENIDQPNITVAVFALVKDGDGARIDNIVEAELGKSKDYVYNE